MTLTDNFQSADASDVSDEEVNEILMRTPKQVRHLRSSTDDEVDIHCPSRGTSPASAQRSQRAASPLLNQTERELYSVSIPIPSFVQTCC